MLNPQFVAGEHRLFGGHNSEDIRTFLELELFHLSLTTLIKLVSNLNFEGSLNPHEVTYCSNPFEIFSDMCGI